MKLVPPRSQFATLALSVLWTFMPVPASAADDAGLANLLAAAVARFPGTLAIFVKHLPSGREASVAASESMSSMSVIKLGILVKAYQMAEQKTLDLDSRVVLDTADFRGGSGVLQYHSPGLNPTVRDLLLEMVITSDNTATDALLARIGGVDDLNRWFADRGLAALRMNGTIGDYFARMARLITPLAQGLGEQELNAALVGQRGPELTTAGKAVAAELAKTEPWLGVCERFREPGTWLGSATARSVVQLLERMETAKLVSKSGSDEMMDMLKNQQSGARRIPMYLDTQYLIGHKTGDFPPCVANDVGIVYLKSGPTVMVFLSDQIHGNYGEAEQRIGEIARSVAEYFDGRPQ